MSDIVKRLRSTQNPGLAVRQQAADEIESLRQQLAESKVILQEAQALRSRLAEADALIAKGLAVVHDFLPNIGRCVLQDYQRMNEFCSEAAARTTIRTRMKSGRAIEDVLDPNMRRRGRHSGASKFSSNGVEP